MEGTKELGLGLIFTARFNEVSAAIDGLKAKLAELSTGFKGVGSPAAAETKKLEKAAKDAAKGLDDAAKGADIFKRAVASSMGESAQYQKALASLGKEAGTSQIRFKDLTGALRAAESAILQTKKTQFDSADAADAWASKVDRVKVAHAFMRDEITKVGGQLLSASKGTKELVNIQNDLVKAYTNSGVPANYLISQLGKQIQTLPELRTKLTQLTKDWQYNASATVEATKVINQHASVMNQMGQNGDKWAAGVNKSAAAQAFLRGEVIKANGELISYGKSSQQITTEMNKLTKGFQDSDTRVKSLAGSFGTGIKTFDDFKAAIKSLNDSDATKVKASKAVLDSQNALIKSYPTLSSSVSYLNEKIKAGNITYTQAGEVLSKMRIKQIENSKAMEAAAKAEAIIVEQKDNLARKYEKLGSVADNYIGMYGKEIKSIKDVTAALDSQMAKLNQKTTGTLKATETEKSMVAVHNESRQAIERLNKQVEAGIITQKRADEASKSIKSGAAAEMLNRQVREGMITQQKADEMLKKYNKTVGDHEKEANKATNATNKLSDTLTNAANGANKAKDYFQQLGYAVKQLSAWMPAALIIASVTSAFNAGVQAIIEYDQALKNLQAITQATDAETAMMGQKILEVSKITKYSASEIGAAMTTIGQAGFNAAQTMDIITPAAQLAQGALEKMDVTADLVTTTLTVFGMKSHEAARAADVLAAAANWSKANLQQLRTAMNYVGPVAKSAGISLEETAAAMMQLFNVGLKASTVGTSFRQLIGAIEAPSTKLRKAMTDAGMSIQELNPKFERTKGVAQGFGGSLEVLSKVLKGDLQKSLQLFGIRVAGTALALSNLGKDGFQLLVEQAGTVGSAAKMAEIQMGGLQVSMKNTANVAKNLAIVVGQPLGEAFKIFLNIAKSVLEVMTVIMDTPFLRETVAWVGLTTVVIGLGVALKTLHSYLTVGIITVTSYMYAWGPHAAMWRATQTAVAAGTASLLSANIATNTLGGTLTAVRGMVTAFYTTLLANPFVAIAAGIAALLVGLVAYRTYSAQALQASEKAFYTHQKNTEALKFYSDSLKEASGSEIKHKGVLDRLVQAYPELQAQLAKTNGSMAEETKTVDAQLKKEEELAKSKLAEYFARLAKEYNNTKKEAETLRTAVKWSNDELTFQQRTVFVATHFWTAFSTAVRKYASVLPGVDSAHKVLGERINKNKELTKEQEAAFIKLGVIIGRNGQTIKEYAEKSGISLGELAKRFPTLQKVIEATIAAQDRFKKAGLNDQDAQEAADVLGAMGDEWVSMYAKADNAQKNFIMSTVQNLNKEKDGLVKMLEEKKITRAQFDQMMIEKERQALDKVEKYQEDHYHKIDKIVQDAFNRKKKAMEDAFTREQQMAEANLKAQTALLNASSNNEPAILKKRVELEKEYGRATEERIKNQQAAELELNKKKEEVLKNFASKESNNADVQKRLMAKVNSDRLADDIATYTKSYEAYKREMDKKISEVERWSAAVKATQREIASAYTTYQNNMRSLDDKMWDASRKGMDDASKNASIMAQMAQKESQYRQSLANSDAQKDTTLKMAELERARSTSQQIIDLAGQVSFKKISYVNGEKKEEEDAAANSIFLQQKIAEAKGKEAELFNRTKQALEERMQYEQKMKEESIAAMNAITKSVTELNTTIGGLNKKKVEIDTESALLQIKKLARDISEVEAKMIVDFVAAGTNEKLDVALQNNTQKVEEFHKTVRQQTSTLKVEVTDQDGNDFGKTLDTLIEDVAGFQHKINDAPPVELVTKFEGEGSAKLPLSEKIEEMKQKLEDFKSSLSDNSGASVVVTFQGIVQDGPTPLSDAIYAVEQQIAGLIEKAAATKPVITIDIAPAEASINTLLAKIAEIAKEWIVTVKANVYGTRDVEELISRIRELRDKTVTVTTKFVNKGAAPAGYAHGGEIPGTGDGDTHPAMLTPGEFVLRKSAVRKYGTQLLHMMNSMVAPIPNMLNSAFGGMAMPQIAMAVPGAGSADVPSFMGTINLQAGNETFPVQAPVSVLNELNTALRRMRKAGVQ